jgi:hypothetical protein
VRKEEEKRPQNIFCTFHLVHFPFHPHLSHLTHTHARARTRTRTHSRNTTTAPLNPFEISCIQRLLAASSSSSTQSILTTAISYRSTLNDTLVEWEDTHAATCSRSADEDEENVAMASASASSVEINEAKIDVLKLIHAGTNY